MNDWETLTRLLVYIQANLDQDLGLAALVVPGPFEPSGLIGYQLIAGGPHAVTTHAGPYETLGAAYATIFPRLAAFKDYDPVGLPAVEVYHAAKINVRFALHHTDICLPMRRKSVA
jgi:DNA gyrase inhibitor GyrI